jgi:UDP-3-O-[3-hydroxymyristoyl] glucosamine N-acyltransferase
MDSPDGVPLSNLAELVRGSVTGDDEVLITGAAPIGDVLPGQITFVDDPKKLKQLIDTNAVAVVVPSHATCERLPVIEVEDVHVAFTRIVEHFRPTCQELQAEINPSAVISPTARLGDHVDVHPGVTIGEDVLIGDNCRVLSGAHLLSGCCLGEGVTIGPNAVLYENTRVGARSMIHAGTVIGAPGFGYRQVDGRHVPTAQLGHVTIGEDVEIGANVTVDRGTYGTTRIGDGTKIDNLVQIAHNCKIGRHNLICSQVGIAGSTTTGDYVVVGGQAGIRDHVHVGTGAILSAMAGISNNVPAGAEMMGIPATTARAQRQKQAALAKLPAMRKEFKAICRNLARLEDDSVLNNNVKKVA